MRPLSALIFWVVLATVLATVYGYWYEVVAQESANAAQLAAEIQNKNQATLAAQAAQIALADLDASEGMVNAYFVSEAQVVPFLEDLQARGKEAGANVKVASVSTDKAGSRAILKVSLQITGPFSSIMGTVGRIEYAPYAITTSSFSVSKLNNTEDSWIGTLNITVGSTATVPAAPKEQPKTSAT